MVRRPLERGAAGQAEPAGGRVPQRRGIEGAGQPLQDEAALHDLATRIGVGAGQLGGGPGLGQQPGAVRRAARRHGQGHRGRAAAGERPPPGQRGPARAALLPQAAGQDRPQRGRGPGDGLGQLVKELENAHAPTVRALPACARARPRYRGNARYRRATGGGVGKERSG